MTSLRAANAGGPELLERRDELDVLLKLFDGVVHDGRGRLALVYAEAGLGKTSLLRLLCQQADAARVLWGACEPMSAPRPLGPFLDIASAASNSFAELVINGAMPHDVGLALLRELAAAPPAILVLDDVHWADGASLDVMRLLARRVASVPVLLVFSYRHTELGQFHGLRQVLGDLGTGSTVTRLRPGPLSPEAVARLASGRAADLPDLYRKTGGNPFFVTEVLAAGGDQIPETVRDAILARTARLSASARGLLEAVAIAPPSIELRPLETVLGEPLEALDECLLSGMLTTTMSAAGAGVAFRHELERATIDATLPAYRKLSLHCAALSAFAGADNGPPDLARLAHHAEGAGDTEAVLLYAPQAGQRAALVGAHREAAAQYARALRFASTRPMLERADLLERHSLECFITTLDEDARESTQLALECYRQLGERRKEGTQLSWLAQVQRNLGSSPQAVETARAAVALLEQLPPGHELAMAYCGLAGVSLLSEDTLETVTWAQRGLELARRLDDREAQITALQTLAAADALLGKPSGIAQLKECLGLARAAGFESLVARAYLLLGVAGCRERSLDRMEQYAIPGLAFCQERDIAVSGRFLLAMHSWMALERGEWDRAADTAMLVLTENCILSSLQARIVLGLVRARRGDPDPWAPLERARAQAQSNGQLFYLWQVAAAQAEAAWLAGRPQAIAEATESTFELAVRLRSPWAAAELAWWRRQGAVREPIPDMAAGPFALQLRGAWAQAGESWRAAGCPYEAALALAESDEDAPLSRALVELQRLGALPAAAIVARKLRERGVRGLPRSQRPSTRANPAGLTEREVEILQLLAEHLRNAEIAERLYLSPRTVDHHVSAILGKLGVRSRAEAARAATRLDPT